MERVALEGPADSSDQAATDPVAEGLFKGLQALAGADADHRPVAAQALNERLQRVKQGDGAAVAKAVLRALEDPALRGAEGVTGPSCRSEAVGALLRLGYPYALQVRPEDLLYHRQQSGASRGRAVTLVTVLVVLLMGMGAAGYLWLMPAAAPPPPPVDQPLSPSGPLPWHNTAPLPPAPAPEAPAVAPPAAPPQEGSPAPPREVPELAPPEGSRPPEPTPQRPPGHPPRPARRPSAGHVPPSAPLRELP
jgi:hypothetical protein